ncbi:hypothetical protein [Nocardioides sp.]|uniref:hypothetical protein n=1 Tax=Nocardioides sp. TaxID=35761 RepID=UPI00286E6D52|nr:hypothetical protein [Nocardioides sp.]
MSRLPVRPLAGALIGALVIVMTSVLGAAYASAVPGDATRSAAIELDTDLTLLIARCEGCVITLLSNDGADPIYSSVPATVIDGSVTVNLPSARTAGMSVRVEPPWLTTAVAADTFVAWRYAGTAIGARIGFKQARTKRRASGCWAGTVNEAVTLTVKVRRVWFHARPGAIAWAPVTESTVPPMERVRDGVLVSDDVLACDLYP